MVLVLLCFLSVAEGSAAFAPPVSVPLCADRSMTFCEEVDEYPAKLITELLQQKKYPLDELFTDDSGGVEEPPEHAVRSHPLKPKRSMRRSSDCGTMRTVRPKLASNRAGRWKFIVQDGKSNKTQKILIHYCNASEECEKHCHQFYSQVPMMSINANGDIFKDMFWMPSSCRCVTKS